MKIAEKIRIIMRHILILLLAFAFLPEINGYEEVQAEEVSNQTEEIVDVPSDGSAVVEGVESSFQLAALTFDPEPVTIDFNQSVTLAALVTGGEGEVVWASSDESVAVVGVNKDGSVTVTGVGGGTATISCSIGEQVRTFSVTVNPPKTLQIMNVEYPSSLKVSQGWNLGGGIVTSSDDLKTLTSTIRTKGGEVVGEPYTQVFDSGVKHFEIKGIDEHVSFSKIQTEGAYEWILVAGDAGGRSVTLNLPIRVVASEKTTVSVSKGNAAPIINIPGDSDNNSVIELWRGEKRKATATRMPGSGTDGDLVWVSYNPSVASVSSDGEITATGAGSTIIICKTWDNSVSSAGYTVNVREGSGVTTLTDGSYTSGEKEMETWSKQGPISVLTDADGEAVMDWQANPVLEWNAVNTSSIRYSELRGKEVTISLEVRSDDADLIDNTLGENGGGFLMDLCLGSEPGVRKRWIFLEPICYPRLSTDWQRISTTLTLTDDAFTLVDDPGFAISDDSWAYLTITNRSTFRMQIRHLKLELGGTVTDWTSAPEDET